MTEPTPLDDLQTLGPSELGKLIGRATKSIKLDATRRPETLPPRFVVPGTRKLLWRVVDVRAWMEALAELEVQRRIRAREFARRNGVKGHIATTGFHLGRKDIGRIATEAMKKDEPSES